MSQINSYLDKLTIDEDGFDQNDMQYSENNPISYYLDDDSATYSVDGGNYFKYLDTCLDVFSYSPDGVTLKNYKSKLAHHLFINTFASLRLLRIKMLFKPLWV